MITDDVMIGAVPSLQYKLEKLCKEHVLCSHEILRPGSCRLEAVAAEDGSIYFRMWFDDMFLDRTTHRAINMHLMQLLHYFMCH